MISDSEIDAILLSKIDSRWRKGAYVVGQCMLEIDIEQRRGLQDLYFLGRVAKLVARGKVEYQGDLADLRRCEVRLTSME